MNDLFSPETKDKFIRERDKSFRTIFGKQIKGNFLIEILHAITEDCPFLIKYYDCGLNMSNLVLGGGVAMDYDICRHIVGCHATNTVFLSNEEKVKLQKDSEYKKELISDVIKNIKLRRYASVFFRQRPILQGEYFIFYNLPYDLFAMTMRMNELLIKHNEKIKLFNIYHLLINKAMASLLLFEDSFLDNTYPLCRSVIELFIKLLILQDKPNVFNKHEKFRYYEVEQSCCGTQDYSDEFNEEYLHRSSQKETKKIDYLHYGWVDAIPKYHNIVKYRPYSFNGLLTYLKRTSSEDQSSVFENLEMYYKMCHGYTHGNVSNSRFPLLHYFEISIILYLTIGKAYELLCNEVEETLDIDDIDIKEKAEFDYKALLEKYYQRSTENFEQHYKKNY